MEASIEVIECLRYGETHAWDSFESLLFSFFKRQQKEFRLHKSEVKGGNERSERNLFRLRFRSRENIMND